MPASGSPMTRITTGVASPARRGTRTFGIGAHRPPGDFVPRGSASIGSAEFDLLLRHDLHEGIAFVKSPR
jgi:hypothetical protein